MSHERICHIFFIFKITCWKFIDLKENTLNNDFQNHYSKEIKHPPPVFCYGEILGIWGSPFNSKSLNFPHLLDITPTKILSLLITDHILEKASLVAFRQIILKIFAETCIFSNTIMNCFTQQPKIYLFSSAEKSLLINLHLLLSKVSLLPHQIVVFT